ncbi:MAG: polynucleotide kinase-phosphatase [Candidatus Accumulibacter sp.]|jgi:protein phosphatase|nr:polynucleotide kinase-phosphatase [Accumulibacter sp.]
MSGTKTIEIPELAVVALIGASGSGKSTFAGKHFKPTEILSSDFFRGMVSDDENDQSVSKDAFEALYYLADKRLGLGRLTVIDATNVQKEARQGVLRLSRERDCHAVAIVLDMPESLCLERNQARPDRNFGNHVVKNQTAQLRRSLKGLEKEGFRFVYVLRGEAEADAVEIVRKPLWNNRRGEHGPFDIIGDVHGCFDELCRLVEALGYGVDAKNCAIAPHPQGRRLVFLGDLCDRGPDNVRVLRLVMRAVADGVADCVIGNHDFKLLKTLKGRKATPSHGLDRTLGELERESEEFRAEVRRFLDSLRSHYVFDDGKLVVAHAGLIEKYQGRGSGRVREFCMFGETSGETDEYGLPVRAQWANDYRGRALVVFGHVPNPEVMSLNHTVCIDTGCVFGGKLTAYRYPEGETTQIAAAREYYRPVKPLLLQSRTDDDTLNIDDVLHQPFISTRLRQNVRIRQENAMAALELMSRFAIDPHWLIYLPPTMSPCETSRQENCLETPVEAFDYYKTRGIARVVCEQKHMGSRAVIVLARGAEAAAKRFGVRDGKRGVIHTRTGRSFFGDDASEAALLERLDAALNASGFWNDFQTEWVCLDAELMPWSAKARQLLEEQYAATGRAGRSGLAAAGEAVARTVERLGDAPSSRQRIEPGQSSENADLRELLRACRARQEALSRYVDAYRRYCWDVASIDDYRIAPFHLLATEGKVWNGENHVTHMETIRRYLTGSDAVFIATPYKVVDTLDEASAAAGARWWEELTEAGNEGMVVKPYDFIAARGKELLQPAIKCRGREYLRIIYGPEYTLGDHLERLKKRGLGRKRALALNEFALGMESLERFVRKEPLYRVHECVFGVLAMESEPVDPRL